MIVDYKINNLVQGMFHVKHSLRNCQTKILFL